MLRDGAALSVVEEEVVPVLWVQEALRDELFQCRRVLAQKRGNRFFARIQPRGEGREQREERGPIGNHALVVRGDPGPCRNVLHRRERPAKCREARSGVAVIRSEGREIDVADERDALGLDEQDAVPPGVPRHVDRAHRYAAAEVPARAVGVGERIRPGHVVELALDLGVHAGEHAWRVAVVPSEPVPAARGIRVGLVHVDRRVRQAVQAGHVVLVHVPEHDEISVEELLAQAVRDERRVESRERVRAAHHDLVAVRVLARLLAEVDADRPEPDDRNFHGAILTAGADSARPSR